MESVNSTQRVTYFVLLLGIFLVFVGLSWLGYFGYLQYAAANVTKLRVLPPLILYSFAFFAGIVSFFAPCAIGILPAYLSYYLNIEESGHKKAVYYGNIAGLGLISFYLVLGLLTIIFGQVIGMRLMTLNREISAAILIIVGLFLLFDISMNLKRFLPLRASHSSNDSTSRMSYEKGIFFFGIFYGVEAFMCAFLLMVPLIIYPLMGGEILTSLVSFIIFSLALGLCMVLTTILISKSRRILTERLMATTKSLQTIAGIVMLCTAAYIVYTIIALPSMSMSGMEMGGMDMGNGAMHKNMDMGK